MHPELYDDGHHIALPVHVCGNFRLLDLGQVSVEDLDLLMHRLREANRDLARIVANRFTPERFSLWN